MVCSCPVFLRALSGPLWSFLTRIHTQDEPDGDFRQESNTAYA